MSDNKGINSSKKNRWVLFFTGIYLFLYLKRPFKKYDIIVSGKNVPEKYYKFRYWIYCKIDKLIDKADTYSDEERDRYDDVSVHIFALNKEDEVIGTVRLIKYTNLGLPTIKEFNLEDRLEKVPRDKVMEISRFMVHPDYRKSMLFIDLCKAVFLVSKEQNIDFWTGCAESWFINGLERLYGEVEIISEPKFCFNAMNYPFFIEIDKIEKIFRNSDPLAYHFFINKPRNFKYEL